MFMYIVCSVISTNVLPLSPSILGGDGTRRLDAITCWEFVSKTRPQPITSDECALNVLCPRLSLFLVLMKPGLYSEATYHMPKLLGVTYEPGTIYRNG